MPCGNRPDIPRCSCYKSNPAQSCPGYAGATVFQMISVFASGNGWRAAFAVPRPRPETLRRNASKPIHLTMSLPFLGVRAAGGVRQGTPDSAIIRARTLAWNILDGKLGRSGRVASTEVWRSWAQQVKPETRTWL